MSTTRRRTTSVAGMTVDHLAAMTKDEVHALPEPDRLLRRKRLEGDQTVLTVSDIGQIFGHKGSDGVQRWRWRYLKNGRTAENALPAPFNENDPPEPGRLPVRKPGDGNNVRGGKGGRALWHRGQILLWGRDVARHLDDDFFPQEGGGAPHGPAPWTPVAAKPPGRRTRADAMVA